MRRRHAIVLLPATTLALSMQTQAPPRVLREAGVSARAKKLPVGLDRAGLVALIA